MPPSTVPDRTAESFGQVVSDYERGRPDHPSSVARWITGTDVPGSVLELGAGTGKLTVALIELGHHVTALDPDERMLEGLRRRVPQAQTMVGRADRLPLPDRSVDSVVAAEAWHWFDPAPTISHVMRVLRPGGTLGVMWNRWDHSDDWVHQLDSLIGTKDQVRDLGAQLNTHGNRFGPVEQHVESLTLTTDAESILALAASRSHLAALSENDRARHLERIADFLPTQGEITIPYDAICFRAQLTEICC